MTVTTTELLRQLPHEPPMRLVDSVQEASNGRAICALEVTEERCWLFGDGASADSYFCAEAVAQTAAIALAQAFNAGPRQGMLMQVKSFRSTQPIFPMRTRLRCLAEVELGVGSRVAMVTGAVWKGDEQVASVKLSLAIGEA